MPNWCQNRVTITHDNEDVIKKIQEEVREDFSEEVDGKTVTGTLEFSFNSIIPMPEEIRNSNSPNHIVATQEEADAHNEEHKNDDFFRPAQTQAQVDALTEKYGVSNWYDWANANWGTKWNLNQDSLYVEIEEDQVTDMLVYEFDTAWSPPEGIYNALVEKYPDVDISWFYHEEGMQMAGYLR